MEKKERKKKRGGGDAKLGVEGWRYKRGFFGLIIGGVLVSKRFNVCNMSHVKYGNVLYINIFNCFDVVFFAVDCLVPRTVNSF